MSNTVASPTPSLTPPPAPKVVPVKAEGDSKGLLARVAEAVKSQAEPVASAPRRVATTGTQAQLPTPAPRLAGSAARAATPARPSSNSTWAFAGPTPVAEAEAGDEEFSAAAETVSENFSVFDNPGNPQDGDDKIAQGDFEDIAAGDYDQAEVRERLAAQGLNAEEVDAAVAEIESAAEFFAESDVYRNALGGERVSSEEAARAQELEVSVPEGPVENPQQAIAVLTGYLPIADTAADGGEPDQQVSRDDLQALLDDPNTPESVRSAASYLLADENEVIFNAIDGAGDGGNANGILNLGNLQAAGQEFENFGESPEGPVDTTAEAAEVLLDYDYLADAASGNGHGASDGLISYGDLEKLAESTSVPIQVREAAQHMLGLYEQDSEDLVPFEDFYSSNLSVPALRAFSEAPPALQQALIGHSSESGNLIEWQDGQPVWGDSGQPVSHEEYAALTQQLAAQVENPEAPALIDPLLEINLREIQDHHQDQLNDVQGDLNDAQAAFQEEDALYARFIAENGPLLSDEQRQQLDAEHQARLDELQRPLEEHAQEFVELAQDPNFQTTFATMSTDEQEEFFESLANQVGNTEAGKSFAEQFFTELAEMSEGTDPSELSVYTQVASRFVSDIENFQTFQEAVGVMGARFILNGGDTDVAVGATSAVVGPQAAEALADTAEQLETAAASGNPEIYAQARLEAAEELSARAQREFPGAAGFVTAAAFALDVATIADQGFSSLQDPAFALQVGGDAAETATIVINAIGVGKGALNTLNRVSGGVGVILGGIDVFQGLANGNYTQAASGALSVAGSALLIAGVGGPAAPLLLAGALVVGFWPALFATDPYDEYVHDRFQDAGLPQDLEHFHDFPEEFRNEIGELAEQLGLPAPQVAFLALSAVSTAYGRPGSAEEVRTALEQALGDPNFGNFGFLSDDDHEALFDLTEQTDLEVPEVRSVIGYIAQEDYMAYLLAHPDSTVSLAEYVDQNIDELAAQVPGAVDAARAAGVID